MTAKLTFCGGAGSVTGANFLLDTGEAKILVDSGSMEQEAYACDTANLEAFPYDPGSIDVLFVTHAHQDHIGRVPKLVRDGFKGTIISTGATKDLAALMFDDAIHIMQDHAIKHGCDVMYEARDAERALSLWQIHDYHESFDVAGVKASFLNAGHILGSAMVRLERGGRSILFTGDLGNTPEPLLPDTESPEGANYIVMESVYGDRVHEGRGERKEHLREAVEETRAKGGVLLIPSFSIERTQVLLFELNEMTESGKMQAIPIYLDAPLATRVTEVFRRYQDELNPDARKHFADNDDPFIFPGLSVVHSTAESTAIHKTGNPKVIIAGAGMSAGGRIRSHEKQYLGDKNATVLFVGYQAPGTLGRRLQDGARSITIDGATVPVHASIESLSGYSGHADRDQLLDFVEKAGEKLEEAFIVMGEPKSSMYFAQRAHDFLGVNAVVPSQGETREINW